MKTFITTISLLASFMVVTQAFATVMTVTVKNSAGGPLPGVGISYKGPLTYNVGYPMGTTDANGVVTKDLAPGSWAFQASYALTLSGWSPLQDNSVDTDAEFQTSAITAEVKTCAGVPISGAGIEYKGASTQNVFYSFGPTGVGGTVSRELFPSTYTFRGSYNHTRLAPAYHVTQDVAANPLVKLSTTKVTLAYSGGIKYSGVDSSPIWPFSKPSMEMFAGPNQFKFAYTGGSTMVAVEVSGCEFSRAMLWLVDANGNGLAGGKATPANGGSWLPTLPGQTDSGGLLFCALDPSAYTKIAMRVNQSGQEKSKAQLLTDNYTWQTGTATINVKHWDGTGFAGVVIDQGGGFWDLNKATTDAGGVAKIPVFAGGAKFRANHNLTSQQITQAVPSTFVFQTGQVHSDAGTCTQWATGSWNSFTQDMEVFPGSYNFKFSDFPQTGYPISSGVVNHIH